MTKLKQKRRVLLLTATAAAVLIVAGLAYVAWQRSHAPASGRDTYRPKAEEGKSTQPGPAVIDRERDPNAGSPTPIPTSSDPQSSKGGEVVISTPTQGATITSGTVVKGTAKTTATRIYYRVKGGKSGQLALGSVSFSGGASAATPYSFELAFTNQVLGGSDQGVLEVFTLGSDGSEQTQATVTVNIQG